MDPAFSTFIARLFQNSLRSGIVKQNFRLTTNKDELTLVEILQRNIRRADISNLLNGERLNIHNSSSFLANMLIKMMTVWNKVQKNKKLSMVDSAYKVVKERICNRRSTLLDGPIKRVTFQIKPELRLLKVTTPKPPKIISLKSMRYQLKPYNVQVTKSDQNTRKHLINKYKGIKSLSLQAITRSCIMEHECEAREKMGYTGS
ncbi:MAG TPA: hypothetical protein VEP90_07990 [Methylomirabilota bacterium]|nr:hypothetical protein [Methylomirabilota bacterium]